MTADRQRLRAAIDAATAVLSSVGIESARTDAELLAAHLAGTDRGRLALLETPDPEFFDRYDQAVATRARRIPLQHITGVAPFGPLLLSVGPGVFIPRPETEMLLEWTVRQHLPAAATIVDLCTGSGALAIALARNWPGANVIGVDCDDTALGYARRNDESGAVQWIQADVTRTGLLPHLAGRVDLVVSNPPYIPESADLQPEVADHDPAHALFGGADGMAIIEPITALAAEWLKPDGLFVVEHDDTTSAETVELVERTGRFGDAAAHRDLAGLPRFVTAIRLAG
jgi:release factor glutamine methyltransferase